MKKGNVILIVVIALVLGYVAGAFIGLPDSDSSMLTGDIGKASAYKKAVSADAKVFEEQIANDTIFRQETEASLQFVQARAEGMLAAAKISREAIKDINELQAYSQVLSDIEEFAGNAIANAKEALDKLALIAEGKSDGGYEDAANKAIVSFTMSDNCNAVVRQYVMAVDEYLKGKTLEDNKQLAFSRDQWLAYDITTSILNNDDSFVKDKTFLLSNEELATAVGLFGTNNQFVARNYNMAEFMKVGSSNKSQEKSFLGSLSTNLNSGALLSNTYSAPENNQQSVVVKTGNNQQLSSPMLKNVKRDLVSAVSGYAIYKPMQIGLKNKR